MIGQTISHYKILERLGQGGMGVVYKALDETLGRTVAIKFVTPSSADVEAMRHRLMREAKACASLNHPNITTIYEYAQADDHDFIVMEYVEGQTLHDLLGQKKFSRDEVLDVLLQILDGLSAAHQKKMVHRDLKASNIMLEAGGRVKIMDFGLAKLSHGSMFTEAGSTIGTAAYMSPEQARGEEADLRSDLYSVGVILYQLLSGHLPFDYPHHLAMMYAIVNEEPKGLRAHDHSIPPKLEAAALKAIAKDPAQRYQSCSEMAHALVGFARNSKDGAALQTRFRQLLATAPAAAIEQGGSAKERTGRTSVRRVLFYAIPAAVAIVIIAYVVLQTDLFVGGGSAAERFAHAYVDSAMAAIEQNNPTLAIRQLEMALEKDSTHAPAWITLAAINIRANRLDLALEQLQKAVSLDPGNSSAMYNLAYVLEEMGKDSDATAWYAMAIEHDSSFGEAYCALGNILIKTGQPREAIGVLLACDRLNPASPIRYRLLKYLGKAHLALGQYSDARSVLERSRDLNAGAPDPETLFLLASAYERLSLRQRSVEAWREYLAAEKDAARWAAAQRHLDSLRVNAP